jgi:hypothetical protein
VHYNPAAETAKPVANAAAFLTSDGFEPPRGAMTDAILNHDMPSGSPFDFTPLLAARLLPPAVKWSGFPKYNFIGGHNDTSLNV